ncbi:MAG: transcription-repair coupling factor [Planctomycetota bacterium]
MPDAAATVTDWLHQLASSRHLYALRDAALAASHGHALPIRGSRGSSTALIAGLLADAADRPVLLVTAHLDEADDALDDLDLLAPRGFAITAERFGALEVLPGESNISLDLLAERLDLVGRLDGHSTPPDVIVAPIQALMQPVPGRDKLDAVSLHLKPGLDLPPGRLLDWLDRSGYTRADAVDQPGDFTTRGGIVDLFPPASASTEGNAKGGGGPIRVDFFGDEIESIHRIDPDRLTTLDPLDEVRIVGASAHTLLAGDLTTNLLDLLPKDTLAVLHEPVELAEQARGYYERLTTPAGITSPGAVMHRLTHNFVHVPVHAYSAVSSIAATPDAAEPIDLPVEPLPAFDTEARQAVTQLAELTADHAVTVVCGKPAEADRLRELFAEQHPAALDRLTLEVGHLHRGFIFAPLAPGSAGGEEATAAPLLLLPHHELFHRYETRRRVRRIGSADRAQPGDAFLDLAPGDYVVHVDHGIAQFTGLRNMKRKLPGTEPDQPAESAEYLTLKFAGDALLHVPAVQIELIQKYIGGFEGKPPLSTLGGKRWGKQKQQVTDAVRDLAKEMIQLQAARTTQPGIRYPDDTTWMKEFEAEFPFDETEDQLAAIAAVKQDMQGQQPMDRLICGDVGFGKTEVAVRAAFKAVEYGKQAAVLVPTTVLAEQHLKTFRGRFADYPFRVESLSRFRTDKQAKDILAELAAGRVDVVVGTHRILSNDVRFADLGLVVIDEEQRFGVEHKNKLLQLRLTADVLTLSATPIPRTLHMALIGLRDISSLATAPVERRAVVTEVIPHDRNRIKQAIVRELNREGQCFFVHNRVNNIKTVVDDLHQLVPDARIDFGHGQMSPRDLEKVMLRFINRELDILVSTTIIESGIDIPTANTMFINQADHFGLAELHQLRGRVGRYKHRAYCYLLLPEDRPVNEVATKRLKAIESYSMLGAGFKIAMRDLELRGAGNLLGAEQSGHIAAVGYEMYCTLLEHETKRLQNQPIIDPARTHLELPIPAAIPKRYIRSDKARMDAYRRLARAISLEMVDQVAKDLADAFGELPDKTRALIDLSELRVAAAHLGVRTLKLDGPDLIFTAEDKNATHRLNERFRGAPGRATVLDDTTLYYRPPANYLAPPATLLAVLRKLLVRSGADAPAG